MRRSRTRGFAVGLVTLSLVAAACGGDDAGDAPAEEPAAEEPAAEEPSAEEPAAEEPAGEEPAEEPAADSGPGGYVWDGSVDEGITDDEILLGSSGALSGPASAYGSIYNSFDICDDYINAEFGGITMLDGVTRQLRFEVLDDAYSPEQTVENARRLVEQEGVFAMHGVLGTPPNTAIVDYMEDSEVPNILVATGATRWGRDFASGEYAYTVGWQPAYQTEGKIYAAFLAENFPGSTVAILKQNDDYGDDYTTGFEAGIEGTDIEIVAVETYANGDPDVSQQMISLADSGADVFFNVTTPKYAAQAMVALASLEWDPVQLLNSVSASIGTVMIPTGEAGGVVEGVYSAKYAEDPTDPALVDDPEMVEYRTMFGKYGPDLNLDDAFVFYAWNSCKVLRQVLDNSYPTRLSLLSTLGHLDEIDPVVPGVIADRISTNVDEGDGWPIEAMQVVQYADGIFEPIGDLIDVDQ
jgi:branched-chain amino acid transport system substrate-binding protein